MIRKTEGTRDGVYDVDFWLINIEGNVFRSTKTAIEFLTNSADYDQTDIDKITTELEKERRQARMLKYDWLENDPSVPIGWRLRHVDGKSARRTFFLSKDGFQFACRRAAYQHMISGKLWETFVENLFHLHNLFYLIKKEKNFIISLIRKVSGGRTKRNAREIKS